MCCICLKVLCFLPCDFLLWASLRGPLGIVFYGFSRLLEGTTVLEMFPSGTYCQTLGYHGFYFWNPAPKRTTNAAQRPKEGQP